MRVRIVVGAADRPGPVVHAAAVGMALTRRGHRAEVWAPAAHLVLPAGVCRHVDVIDTPPAVAGDPAGLAALLAADAARCDEAPCVHHAQDAVGAVALLDLRRRGLIPHVVRTVHHLDVAIHPADDERQRASLADVDARICVSASWAQRLDAERGLACVVIANGLEAAPAAPVVLSREAAGRRFGWEARPAVLTLGGVSRRKASRVVLEAFARAGGRLGGHAVLVIAGAASDHDDDYERAWRADADRLGLVVGGRADAASADIVLTGTVDGDELPLLHRAVDVMAYPSTREGSALAVFEAARDGVASVVSDIAPLRDQLTDGLDCLMVPSGHSAPLADALVRLTRDRALRRRVVAGAARTASRHSWDAAARAHEDLYRSLPGMEGPSASQGPGDGGEAIQVGGFGGQCGHGEQRHGGQRGA